MKKSQGEKKNSLLTPQGGTPFVVALRSLQELPRPQRFMENIYKFNIEL
jgi:hypothetical protein